MRDDQLVADIKRALSDPREVAAWLGLDMGPRPQRQAGGGVFVRCPVHNENSPSLSLTIGQYGTLRAHCFGCGRIGEGGRAGDVFSLVAAVHGLDVRQDFRQVLAIAAERAGVQLDDSGPASEVRSRAPLPVPAPQPAKLYPDAGEVARMWADCVPVTDDEEVAAYLASRGLDPHRIADRDLARTLPHDAATPRWAWFGGPWGARGYRLVLPMIDPAGSMRSLRARLIHDAGEAKSVAPSGVRSDRLIMADATGRIMLATGEPPPWYIEQFVVFVCEGEVDFWTVAAWVSDTDETPPAVLGVTSSSWCAEVAARVPEGSLVITLTDDDEAGDRYAGTVRESLRDRAVDVRDRKRRGPRAKARS